MAEQILSLPIQNLNQTRNDAVSKRVVHNTRPEKETQTSNTAKPANEEIKDLSAPTPPGDPKKPFISSLRNTIGTEENPLTHELFVNILREDPDYKDFSNVVFEDGFNFGCASIVSLLEPKLLNTGLYKYTLEAIDFRGARLRKAKFSDQLCFFRCNFNAANLTGSSMPFAKVKGCNFNNANLKESNFYHADLDMFIDNDKNEFKNSFLAADLTGSGLEHSFFINCDLEGAILDKCNLRRTSLKWASLKNTSLKEASLIDPFLFEADFEGADLSGAYIRNATATENYTPREYSGFRMVKNLDQIKSLEGARVFNPLFPEGFEAPGELIEIESNDYSGVNLPYLDIQTTCFTDINFEGANLLGAKLFHITVSNCNFTNANLSHVDMAGKFENCDFSLATFNNMNSSSTTLCEFRNCDFSSAMNVPRLMFLGSIDSKGLPGNYENMNDEASLALNRDIESGRLKTGINFKSAKDIELTNLVDKHDLRVLHDNNL